MRTRKKWLWLIFGIAAIALVLLIWGWGQGRSEKLLVLPGGERYRFMGITHGTNGVPPPVLWTRALNYLPDKLSRPIRKKLGPRIPNVIAGWPAGSEHYWVWFELVNPASQAGTSPPPYEVLAGDETGSLGGTTVHNPFGTKSFWTAVVFEMLPRRSRILKFYFYPDGTAVKGNTPAAEIAVPNPLFGQFPQWKTESLPDVKQNGDLEARLDNVGWQPITRGTLDEVTFNAAVHSPVSASWYLDYAELGDATSNALRAITIVQLGSGAEDWSRFKGFFSGPLWAGETVWRIKLGFKRVSGLAPEELFTITNVPIPAVKSANGLPTSAMRPTGSLACTNSFGAMKLTLHQPAASGRQTASRAVEVEAPGIPADMTVTCIGAVSDAGPAKVSFASSRRGNVISTQLSNVPTNAQTMNFTFAVQKVKSVEFFFKPPEPQ